MFYDFLLCVSVETICTKSQTIFSEKIYHSVFSGEIIILPAKH